MDRDRRYCGLEGTRPHAIFLALTELCISVLTRQEVVCGVLLRLYGLQTLDRVNECDLERGDSIFALTDALGTPLVGCLVGRGHFVATSGQLEAEQRFLG